MVVMLQQWEEAQEGDLWLSCCIRTAAMGGGSGGRPVVVMLHQWEEAQEGDLWLSCCIRTAAMGGGSGG